MKRKNRPNPSKPHYCIIGGGIAGVSCAQELSRLLEQQASITLITASEILKEAKIETKVTPHLEELVIAETKLSCFESANSNINVVLATVVSLDSTAQTLSLNDGKQITYDKLCICTGAVPNLVYSHPDVIGLRDVDSVSELIRRLQSARHVALIGNGGIALEIFDKLDFCSLEWIVKDSHLGSAFFDASASEFLIPGISHRIIQYAAEIRENNVVERSEGACVVQPSPILTAAIPLQTSIVEQLPVKKVTSTIITNSHPPLSLSSYSVSHGSSLGPGWDVKAGLSHHISSIKIDNDYTQTTTSISKSQIHYNQEVCAIDNSPGIKINKNDDGTIAEEAIGIARFPLYVHTTSGLHIGCDFVVSATGVTAAPCLSFAGPEHIRDTDIIINRAPSNSNRKTDIGSTVGSGDVNTISTTSSSASNNSNSNSNSASSGIGALVVDEYMETSVKGVFAAGDCCAYRPATATVAGCDENNKDADGMMTHWFQMRLWTQARQMGHYAAHCMCRKRSDDNNSNNGNNNEDRMDGEYRMNVGEPDMNNFFLEIFAHVTHFLGYKVILLGRFNGQGLNELLSFPLNHLSPLRQYGGGGCGGGDISTVMSTCATTTSTLRRDNSMTSGSSSIEKKINQFVVTQEGLKLKESPSSSSSQPLPSSESSSEVEIWLRVTKNVEYIKLVLFRGRVVGAVLIGETDLEETIENLILDKTDVSRLGIHILDPEFDVDDYFD